LRKPGPASAGLGSLGIGPCQPESRRGSGRGGGVGRDGV